jgi:DNA-binding Lrp family transcriptional regulator
MSAFARGAAGSRKPSVGTLEQHKQPDLLLLRGETLQMDEIDQRIIALLIADARQSYAEIGTRVSLSAPAVKRRVDRLRAGGVIRAFTTVVDPAAVGWTTEAFVELFCTGRTTPAQLTVATRRHPEVVGAYTVSGEADALVHLRAADIAHLEQALERLRAEPFVTSTRSMIVLSRLVDSPTVVPAPVAG